MRNEATGERAIGVSRGWSGRGRAGVAPANGQVLHGLAARGGFFLGCKAYLCVRLIVAAVGADLAFVGAADRCGYASPMVEVTDGVRVVRFRGGSEFFFAGCDRDSDGCTRQRRLEWSDSHRRLGNPLWRARDRRLRDLPDAARKKASYGWNFCLKLRNNRGISVLT